MASRQACSILRTLTPAFVKVAYVVQSFLRYCHFMNAIFRKLYVVICDLFSFTELQEKIGGGGDRQFYLFKVLRAHILPLTNVAFNKSGSW